jgi:capsular exopolysaccharide synthesis family protein
MLDDSKHATIPAIYEGPRYVARPIAATTYTATPEPEAGPATVPLAHYLWILRRRGWQLASFVGVCVAATLLISLRLTPVYEATAIVDIDRQTPPGIIGQDATRTEVNDADQFIATQVKLIQSDSVLRPIVDKYRLREVEEITVDKNVRRVDAEDAPVVLKKLKISRPPNTYLLLISYRSTDPKLSANVANGIAHSYIEHTFNLRFKASASLSEFMEKQIDELKAKMERSTDALAQFERELNVINPEEKTSIVSARLLQLNEEYTNAQTDRVRKEAAARSQTSGSLEAAQSSTQGESLRRLAEHLTEAQEKFAQVQSQFGVNHPEYRKSATQVAAIERALEETRLNISKRVGVEHREAIAREQMLAKALAETKAEFDRLNAKSFQYQQLKREADSDKKLYEELVTKIKEAGINANFQNSSISMADPARAPVKPVFPKVGLNLILAFLFSTFSGIAAAVLLDLLDNSVRDPDELSRSLNTAVIGTLPSVKAWRKSLGPISVAGSSNALAKLESGEHEPAEGFAESIRTLRNSILLADFDRRLKSVLVTSANPSEGKSTTAAYLAISHAQQGKKTLLIDGDLRRPSIHRRFDLPSGSGLSNILLGETNWRDVVLPVPGTMNLEVIPAGPASRRAADIVGASIGDLLEEISREYDLVILDAPPLLGFAEPLQMATGVDGVLIVARAGETNRKSLASVVSTLTRLRANVIGMVLNEVRKGTHDGYYYGYYGYYAKYYRQK